MATPTTRSFAPDDVVLDKYRVVRVLGSGGYGMVVEAENVRTTRRVAIKVLHGEGGGRASTAMKRLHNEARAAARLTHPNSVDVLDLETDDDGTLFFVQELLVGETLHDRLSRDERVPWEEAFDVMLPVMSALAEAHRRGIVHRDVKPENIFLCEAAPGVRVPKIIDFGVARVFDEAERLTAKDRVVGTPWYMSPEQARGARDLDGQTDVWAVGVVLYELLTGASPFTGPTVKDLMAAIVGGDHTPLRLRNPEVPAAVAEVIERALLRDRDARYRTMDDFLDAALACVGRRVVPVGTLVMASQGPAPAPVSAGRGNELPTQSAPPSSEPPVAPAPAPAPKTPAASALASTPSASRPRVSSRHDAPLPAYVWAGFVFAAAVGFLAGVVARGL